MGRTTDLRCEIKRSFVPHVEARGFKMDLRYAPNFFEFRRVSGDELHIFDIQWEKSGKRRFVVNFGTCSAEGAAFGGQQFPPEIVGVAQCPTNGRLQPGKGGATWNWFCQDKPLLKRLFSRDSCYPAEMIVEELTSKFEELEAFWERNKVGSHLRIFQSR